MVSDDPDFETKAADIIGLYLNPPQHAAVFCVDEKTAIQALDRLDPVLPLSPGRIERHGFEYYRHGTLSLYAALDTATGRVHGKTAARHTSQDFIAFSRRSSPCARLDRRSISSSTISRLTRPRWSGSSWNRIHVSDSTSRPLTPPGSTRSNCGSPKSSVKSSPVASLPPCPIWPASCDVTSTRTPPMPSRFSGSTQTLPAASVVTNSLRQATSSSGPGAPSSESSAVDDSPGETREALDSVSGHFESFLTDSHFCIRISNLSNAHHRRLPR